VYFSIRRLVRAGYHVVAYQTTNTVFTSGDPTILPELIAQIRDHMKKRVAELSADPGRDFGFFGSSLGSFILYNCVGSADGKIPELRWGVFNTGGNIAAGLWRMQELRLAHEASEWSLPRLEEAWAPLQWPDFGRLDGARYLFASSRGDNIAPLADIAGYLGPMLEAGADVSVHPMTAFNHRSTVITGLWQAPRLIRMVRTGTSQAGQR
jgi:hypothetical protein